MGTGSSELTTNIHGTTNGNVMQKFYSVVQYNAITLSVLLKEYYSYKLQLMVHTANFKCNVNHKG
jgi:hypothetical protein